MPTYEYICRACGHEFEEFHSIKADPISVCPKCRKKKVERKIGIGGAVIFKGGGFYETDYRSESYKSGADAEKKSRDVKPEAKLEGKSEGKSDGKSDAKPDAPKSDASKTADAKPGPGTVSYTHLRAHET
jgi:putative FmdB family regulatory protein